MKLKYKYCASVAYYAAKLFKKHKFKVIDDRESILKAFESEDESILTFYEDFYKDMLKNDRACEKDLFNFSTPEKIKDHSDRDDDLTLAELIDGVRNLKKNNHRKGYNPRSLTSLKPNNRALN